ncbi:hypothetical protein JT180_05075, partial [Helicobacter pylori]|nr:hypothetical protein [Helicobacter pylori]
VNNLNDGSNSPLTRINQDRNCTGLQKCFMSKETYDKMKTLAESLQAAQQNATTKGNNLCALSGCATTQGSPNSTVSSA